MEEDQKTDRVQVVETVSLDANDKGWIHGKNPEPVTELEEELIISLKSVTVED